MKFDIEMQALINKLIKEDYSPEQIAGVLKKQGVKTISRERIYTNILEDKKKKGNLYKH